MLDIGIYELKEPQYVEWDCFGEKGNGIAIKYEVEQEQTGYILKGGGYMCTDYITKRIPYNEYIKSKEE